MLTGLPGQAFYDVKDTSGTFARQMIVAVNTRTLPGTRPEGYSYFIRETFSRITRDNPGDQFIFITDPSLKKELGTSTNGKIVVSGPQNKHPLLWKYWYDIKLPALLRKYKADLCIAAGGHCSGIAKTAQALLLYDPSLTEKLYQKQLGRSLQKAGQVIVFSASSKAGILAGFDAGANKIEMIRPAPHAFSRVYDDAEKRSVKEQYSSGKEFFLYTSGIDPLKKWMTVLKAFSVFKKRQQSGIKLVMTVEPGRHYLSFIKDLSNYKYREDVVLVNAATESERAGVMGAAYAFIDTSGSGGLRIPLLDALRSGVAVIVSAAPSEEEIFSNAVLPAGADPASLADAMMRLYKDETLRDGLIQKGIAAAGGLGWDSAAKLLWTAALKTIR